jgi:hypothetical protein
MQITQNLFYLETASGQLVRSLHWNTDILYVVYNKNSRRVEAMTTTENLDDQLISYDILDVISKEYIRAHKQVSIIKTNLKLVTSPSSHFIMDPPASKDQMDSFYAILQRTAGAAVIIVVSLFSLNAFFPPISLKMTESQLVRVIDREALTKIAKPVVSPAKNRVAFTPSKNRVKNLVRSHQRKSRPQVPRGEIGILGMLTKNGPTGGLQLNAVGATRGIGRGGKSGSGGVQTAVFSQGLFAAPLGTGDRPQGAGGYGTKGKGGGQAGYGKQSLIGTASGNDHSLSSDAVVEGGLDPNEIAAVIQRHESEIRACYEKGLRSQPDLKGRLSMKFLIGSRGQVTAASISSSSLNHTGVETCIQARLRSWPFPQPEGGVTVKVSYPFVLKRVSGT